MNVNAAAMDCRAVEGPEAERHYLEALNVCFPAWGGREMFDWCFARESAGLRPDLMTLHAGGCGRPVAGSANTYRRVRLPNGRTLMAAIMTGSWTLPESRGLGAFTRVIGESRERAAARGAGLLLAFVTHTNASANRLRDAGAALFPTWYARSPAERRDIAGLHEIVDVEDIKPIEDDVEENEHVEEFHGFEKIESRRGHPDFAQLVRRNVRRHADGDAGAAVDGVGKIEGVEKIGEAEREARFVYTASEWREQFVLRPTGVARLRMRVGGAIVGSAIVERTPQFDRVISVSACLSRSRAAAAEGAACGDALSSDSAWDAAIGALEARAAAAGRRLFCFTSRAAQASRLRERGFEIVNGYLTALIANETVLRSALAPGSPVSGALAPGARVPEASASHALDALSSQALADAASPWYLGGWSVQNGDRM